MDSPSAELKDEETLLVGLGLKTYAVSLNQNLVFCTRSCS